MQVCVECYSGYRVDERPVCFYLGEKRYRVDEVLDQWYGPDDHYFRVRADDGNLYILRNTRTHDQDTWVLESFRRL